MYKFIVIAFYSLLTTGFIICGEKTFIELKDFSRTELKSSGFKLNDQTTIHVKARGAASEKKRDYRDKLFAYGWIINSDTREKVWLMTRDNTSLTGTNRKCDDYITLPKGSYEVYFAATYFDYQSTFTNIRANIDHRKSGDIISIGSRHDWIASWIEDWFGVDIFREWMKNSKNWGIELLADERAEISLFNPPQDFSYVLYKSIGLGENEYVQQGFVLDKPVAIHIYALGEGVRGESLSDFGFIIDVNTRKRIWEMKQSNTTKAGGADKNLKFDGTVNLNPGKYVVYYFTDDSHSYIDWNEAPPYDPLNYGITLMGQSEADRNSFNLFTYSDEKNVITAITKLGNDENRSEGFTLKQDMDVRIYAIGERYYSRRQMADYGWIINAQTREKVWEMNVDKTVHAGGGTKNRMIDEIVHLVKGNYIVNFQSDDSHSYNDWNVSPPYDQEHWGITIYAVENNFEKSAVDKFTPERDKNIIAQIVRVRDNANLSETFKLNEPTRIRIYSIGEGQRNEMFDYGSIENVNTGKIIWEMTASMSFHAGGARKNRIVNTTILLDKGDYRLRYRTDDSHSYNSWNDTPPEDALYWGITLYREDDNK